MRITIDGTLPRLIGESTLGIRIVLTDPKSPFAGIFLSLEKAKSVMEVGGFEWDDFHIKYAILACARLTGFLRRKAEGIG